MGALFLAWLHISSLRWPKFYAIHVKVWLWDRIQLIREVAKCSFMSWLPWFGGHDGTGDLAAIPRGNVCHSPWDTIDTLGA